MEIEFLSLKNSLLLGGPNSISAIEQTIEKAKKLYDFIQVNGFFSDNEELQDLPSFTIRYLSVPFLYALALLSSRSSSSRIAILEHARNLTEEFLHLVQTYDFRFEDVDLKIRNDKLTHRKKLEDLKIFSFLIDKIPISDEERYRAASVNFVKFCILSAQWELDMLQRELTLLNDKTLMDDPNPSEKKAINTLVLDHRKLKLQNVFRPGHSLPTMTVQEFYDKAYKNFKPESPNKIPVKESSDDEEDIYKLRIQDEFNDLNPRGSGNRQYRS